MAWISPVTDRVSAVNFTHEDMSRICGNINFIGRKVTSPTYQTLSKEYYIESDIVTQTQWTAVITAVNAIADLCSMTHATSETTWQNVNQIEAILLKQYTSYVRYPDLDLYPSNNLYPQ